MHRRSINTLTSLTEKLSKLYHVMIVIYDNTALLWMVLKVAFSLLIICNVSLCVWNSISGKNMSLFSSALHCRQVSEVHTVYTVKLCPLSKQLFSDKCRLLMIHGWMHCCSDTKSMPGCQRMYLSHQTLKETVPQNEIFPCLLQGNRVGLMLSRADMQ